MRLLAPTLLLVACTGPGPEPTPDLGPAQRPSDGRFSDRLGGQERVPFRFAEQPTPSEYWSDEPAPLARLEVRLPRNDPFVLHATLPVLPGTWPRADGKSPLGVAHPGGTPYPAQVSALTRNASGQAEVVTLRARISRPEGGRPGERVFINVVEGPFDLPPEGLERLPATARLLDPTAGQPVHLRTRDVFGNLYVADLLGDPHAPGAGSRVVVEDGHAQQVVRTYATLVPLDLSGEGDPRPHLMGVHAYWTVRSGEQRVGLDLRVNNGATPGSRPPTPEERPLGIIHWDTLELVIPGGWTATPLVDDPFLGAAYQEGDALVLPLVAPPDDGAMHMMPPQAQFQRRLTLQPAGQTPRPHPLLEGLAFPRAGEGLWSWWNPATARYFPQAALLPDWSSLRIGGQRGQEALRARLTRQRDAVRQTIQSGSPQAGLLAGKVMGWAHPLGVSVQGMTGGSGIAFLEGHQAASAASVQGVEAFMLEHRMNASRQGQAQYDGRGEPVGFDAWLDPDGVIPFDFRTNGHMAPQDLRLPIHGGLPADRQVHAVHAQQRRADYDQGSPHRAGGKLSGGDGSLFSWRPHDGQHFARWTHRPMALAWLTGDALAIDDIRQAAETFHLMFHGAEHARVQWSPGVTLRQLETVAAAHPHHGLPIGRDEAWGIDVMCAAWLLEDDPWRLRRRAWFPRVARVLVDGAMPSGIIQRRQEPKLLEGKHGGAQAFETLFLLHAKRCLIEACLAEEHPALAEELAAVHQLALDYLFWGPVWDCVDVRGEPSCGPRWHFATGPPDDISLPPYSDEAVYGPRHLPASGMAGPVDVTYIWAPLEYGMLLARGERGPSLDDRYLRRALTCDRAPAKWDSLLETFFSGAQRDGSDLSGNWGSLAARIQTLLGERQDG